MGASFLVVFALFAPLTAGTPVEPHPGTPASRPDSVRLTAASPVPTLDALTRALAASPAWRARFVQRYLPSGFDEGTSDEGTVVIEAPARLRFDYAAPDERTFAVDGSVARHVDPVGGICDAVRLDSGVWSRLPLAAILDPAAARDSFEITAEGDAIRLVPRTGTDELAAILLTAGRDGLPSRVVVFDPAGNRNEFAFSNWARVAASPTAFFSPALPGSLPCKPEQP